MARRRIMIATGMVALGAALVAMAPAIGASDSSPGFRPAMAAMRGGVGYFTPAAADPKLAAIFVRGGLNNVGFRFTPVVAGKNRAVTVAVRSLGGARPLAADRLGPQTVTGAVPSVGIQPVSYSLGAGVGWKRFAPVIDVAKVETGFVAAARDRADVGITPGTRKWNTRLQVAAERPIGQSPRTLTGTESYSLDVGGSYRLTRNLDVTAGVRVRSERDRLQKVEDNRRDSQAVYVGTAFRF